MTNKRVVATIWPASESEEMLKKILPYIAIARMNMSHWSYLEHQTKIDRVRKLSKDTEILIDLQGPKIRLWKFPDWPVNYKTWECTHLIYDKWNLNHCDKQHLYVSIPHLITDLNVWDVLLFNDWYLSAKVLEKRIQENRLYIEILNDWFLASNKWVNTSTASLSVEPLTEKDLADLEFWISQNPEYVALSFVRSGDDVKKLKNILKSYNSNAKVIVKIERHEAIKNLDEIIVETDVVMIARWDLWVEVDQLDLPRLQLEILEKSKKAWKPCIWATQVLESMTSVPRPTRAELTDVYTAITSWSDYTMLSGESASWNYPYESVKLMADMWEKYSE